MTTTWIGLSISTGLLLIAAGCEGPVGEEYGGMGGSAEQGSPSAPAATTASHSRRARQFAFARRMPFRPPPVKSGESFAASLEEPIVVGTTVIAA